MKILFFYLIFVIILTFPFSECRHLFSNDQISSLIHKRLSRSPLSVISLPERPGSQPFLPGPQSGSGNLCVDRRGGNLMGSAGYGGSFNINGVNPPNGPQGASAGLGFGPQYMLGGGYQGNWRQIRSPQFTNDSPSDFQVVPSKSMPFTPSRPQSPDAPYPRLPAADLPPPSNVNSFRPFPGLQQNSPLPNPPSPMASGTNPFPPLPFQQQNVMGPTGAFPQQPLPQQPLPQQPLPPQQQQQQQQQQIPLLAAIERAKSFKQAAQNNPSSGFPGTQNNMSNLCVNRRGGQLDGQINQQSSMDLNIQGWTKDGPYGFRSGSTISRPTVFGANWGGPLFVHDC